MPCVAHLGKKTENPSWSRSMVSVLPSADGRSSVDHKESTLRRRNSFPSFDSERAQSEPKPNPDLYSIGSLRYDQARMMLMYYMKFTDISAVKVSMPVALVPVDAPPPSRFQRRRRHSVSQSDCSKG
jgi:hypothetical protein